MGLIQSLSHYHGLCSERIEQIRSNNPAKPTHIFRLFRNSIPITPDHIHHVTHVRAIEVRAV